MNKLYPLIIIALLISIFGTLFKINENIGNGITSTQNTNSATTAALSESDIASLARQETIKEIILMPIKNKFKFPESVKIKDMKFEYKKVYDSHGIPNIPQEKEVETVRICGQLAAMNGMGAYGTYEPFYGEVTINNNQKSFGGESWAKIDGNIKKTISLDIDYLTDGDRAQFDKLLESMNCGDADKSYMGVFSAYKDDFTALVSKEMDSLLNENPLNDEAKSFYSKCLNNIDYPTSCIDQYECLYGENANDSALCKGVAEICGTSVFGKECSDLIEAKDAKVEPKAKESEGK